MYTRSFPVAVSPRGLGEDEVTLNTGQPSYESLFRATQSSGRLARWLILRDVTTSTGARLIRGQLVNGVRAHLTREGRQSLAVYRSSDGAFMGWIPSRYARLRLEGLGELGAGMTPQHATPAVSSTVGLQRLFYKLVQAAKDNAPRGVDDYSFLVLGAGRYRVAVIPVWTTEIVGGRLSAIRVYNLIVREPGRSGLTWNRRYSGGVEAVANQMADALAEAAGLSRGALGRRLGTSRLFGLGQGHEAAHSNVGRDGRSTGSIIESIGQAFRNVAEGTAAVVREGERASVARAGGSSEDAPPPDMSMYSSPTTTGFLSSTGGKVLIAGAVGLAILATILFLSRSKKEKNRRRNARRRRRSMGLMTGKIRYRN